jgi:hypothetical protein
MVTLLTPSDQGWDVPKNNFKYPIFCTRPSDTNGWTGNNFGVSRVFVPSEIDTLRGEFYASSTFVHLLPKPYFILFFIFYFLFFAPLFALLFALLFINLYCTPSFFLFALQFAPLLAPFVFLAPLFTPMCGPRCCAPLFAKCTSVQ